MVKGSTQLPLVVRIMHRPVLDFQELVHKKAASSLRDIGRRCVGYSSAACRCLVVAEIFLMKGNWRWHLRSSTYSEPAAAMIGKRILPVGATNSISSNNNSKITTTYSCSAL